jgi:hypothetical protein
VAQATALPGEHSGFHVMARYTNDLQMIAVSDVDPTRLTELVDAISQAQVGERRQSQ